MKLVEYRGKELLTKSGIRVPAGVVITNSQELNITGPVMLKAQVVGGKRKKQGLIAKAENQEAAETIAKEFFSKTYNNAPVTSILVEDALDVQAEYFLSVLYDTDTRGPMIVFSEEGGIDIEETGNVTKHPFSISEDPPTITENKELQELITKAVDCFKENDCIQLEINPIIKTAEGLYAGDAKITIDDASLKRHDAFKDIQEDTSFLTDLEREARKIDEHDHRGVAGKTFVEMNGDLAVIAIGGGASLTSMDAIVQAGGKPANYTEFSGNPPREKVARLTELTLSQKNLKGCIVVGGKANFTDVYETLGGFMDVIVEKKPDYPIVIRRAGPRDKEAFAMLRERADKHNIDLTLYGEEMPMSKAAHIIVEKVSGC
ncbi:MAG: hypothetical protein OXR66_05390 [Candidatus Woesearchaeota archaeon]|nr:hypothetical protein [Candidatus Woesearchaeota archaeon]